MDDTMFDANYRHHVSPHVRAALDRLRDPQAVWDLFRDDRTVDEMRRVTALKRPAVVATSARLLALGGWVRDHDAKRTFGKLARCVMESVGYAVEKGNVETPNDPLFTKGTRYRPRSPEVSRPTPNLVIRNVAPETLARLHVRAARNQRSIEAEAAQMLAEALRVERDTRTTNLAESIRRRFADIGGADDLEPHPSTPMANPPALKP
jgi:plasmid stability protein